MVKNGRRTAVDERTIDGRVLMSYGDHYSYLDTTTTSDGTPIYESRGFNGGQHTWYLLNSEIRRIGEIFAQAPDKFELVNDDRSGAFCRIYALDHFEARIVRDIAAAMRWTSPRKETYYHITQHHKVVARWRVSLGRCSARDRENRKARGNSSGSGNGCCTAT